jgi:GNAT superfamily N-acetyltransferase
LVGGVMPPLMDGYVWIADGKLVGNVSLMRESGARGLWSLSNVAVLPAYRCQGIARRLVEAAIRRAVDRGAHRLVLEVTAENEAARHLYRALGFVLYDTVHELVMPRIRWPEQARRSELPLRPRCADDARGLYDLARVSTPQAAQEVKPVAMSRYQMGFADRLPSWLARLLRSSLRRAWVLEDSGAIAAALQIVERYSRNAHQLDIMVHPQHRGTVEHALLDRGFYELSRFPLDLRTSVSEAHPQAVRVFEKAGFDTVRVLAQMTLDLGAMKYGVVL